jgi:hypothetical protein
VQENLEVVAALVGARASRARGARSRSKKIASALAGAYHTIIVSRITTTTATINDTVGDESEVRNVVSVRIGASSGERRGPGGNVRMRR